MLGRTRAVAVDRCLAVVEVGTPSPDVVARYDAEMSMPPGAGDATATADEEAPNPGDLQDEMTPHAGVGSPPTPGYAADAAVASISPGCPGCRSADIVTQAGYYRAWYEDRVNLDVNVVRQELFWAHEGPTGCVRSDSSVLKLSKLEETGWTQNAANRRRGYTCSRAFSSAYAKFSNDVFCRAVVGPIIAPLLATTRVFYNRSIVRGFNTGTISGATRSSKKGGCSELLSFNHIVRHTE